MILVLVGVQAFSQGFSTAGWWKPAGDKFSPVVHPDRSITFRLAAPQAGSVLLRFGEGTPTELPMLKDADGVWSVTIGPQSPRTYEYSFIVDGVKMPDMKNPEIKSGTEIYGSVVHVREALKPNYDDPVHAGSEVDVISYRSSSLGTIRKVWVYVPSCYHLRGNRLRRFPVLYLRHGGGDSEESWTRSAYADNILDNLIAEGKAVPMIVAMTDGMTDGSWAGGSTPEAMDLLESELLDDVIPLIESRYRTKRGARSRAIAGLSMGGGQAYVIGMRNPDKFAYVADFCAGLLSDPSFDHGAYGISLEDPGKINSKISLLWISCGTLDPRYEGTRAFVDRLRKAGLNPEWHEAAYNHEWEFWREQLRDLSQELFTNKR